MARSRNIKPGFYMNEELAQCSLLARYIFPGLWMMADRCGRLEDRPLRIKATILPYDNGDVNKMLDELQDAGLILRYSVDGQKYIQIVNFEKHQSPHYKEPESTIPAPDDRYQNPRLCPQSSNAKPQTFSQECDLVEGKTALIPDSGYRIPDSGYLIPDSHTEETSVSEHTAAKKTNAGRVCSKLAKLKILGINQGNPLFTALLDAGATDDEFLGAAQAALERKKPQFNYILGIVKRQREEAASLVLHKGALPTTPPRKTIHEKRSETAKAMFGDLTNGNDDSRIIDVSSDSTSSDRPALSANG